jgi:hypothetical protein
LTCLKMLQGYHMGIGCGRIEGTKLYMMFI